MNNYFDNEKRQQIEVMLSSCLYESLKIFDSKTELVEKMEKLLSNLENIFENNSENIQELLGGEFNKDIIMVGSYFDTQRSSLPLYFILDIIGKGIETIRANNFANKEELISLLDRIKALKEKSSKLEFSKKFDPNQKINDYVLDEIVHSKGNFYVESKVEEGIKHLAIQTQYTIMNGEYKSGDWYERGPTEYHFSRFKPLYEIDDQKIRNVQYEKTSKNIERLDAILEKYFVDKKIPRLGYTEYTLKDKNIDSRFLDIFRSIAYTKEKNPFAEIADLVVSDMDELERLEIQIKQEKIEEEKRLASQKEKAIDNARKRYKDKNFLWKFFNKKMAPKNQEFDNMTIEEINELYVSKRGRR